MLIQYSIYTIAVMRNIMAIIGGMLAIVSVIPYMIDIVKRRTKPNIVSWFTWTLLTGIAMLATFAAGEINTGILMAGSTICTTIVVILGIKYGIAKFSWFDGFCQIGAIVGLILWLVFDSPTVAIIASVTIDCIAMLPTLRHSWVKPGEETWQTFIIGVIAPVFTIASLQTFTLDALLYPFYLVIANALIALTVIIRRKQQGISLSRYSVHATLHE